MIPKKIHYCWFGGTDMPELALRCIDSWHRHMPDWEYVRWDETNFDLLSAPLYVQEAYASKKYAFVSDYVRLYALEQQGGVYLDTDVEVIQSYEPLLANKAFIGFEESKNKGLGTNCIGSEAHLSWLKEEIEYYQTAKFVLTDNSINMVPNSEIIANHLTQKGLLRNGKEQQVGDVHVYDFHYFSPITSTRVKRTNKSTYSIHHYAGSWLSEKKGCWWKNNLVMREIINALVQLKRLV